MYKYNEEAAVVIFCKNEVNSIKNVITDLKKKFDNIYVVDGGSNDGSDILARKLGAKVLKDNGEGKGSAIRMSIRNINKKFLVFMDADGSHRPKEVVKLLKAIYYSNADMVIASRLLGRSEEYEEGWEDKLHLFGNLLVTKIINCLWQGDVTDTQNGFRVVRRESFSQLNLTEKSFAIEQEMVIKCLKNKKKIIEIPSFEKRRIYGSSHINPFIMLPKYVLCLIKNLVKS